MTGEIKYSHSGVEHEDGATSDEGDFFFELREALQGCAVKVVIEPNDVTRYKFLIAQQPNYDGWMLVCLMEPNSWAVELGHKSFTIPDYIQSHVLTKINPCTLMVACDLINWARDWKRGEPTNGELGMRV